MEVTCNFNGIPYEILVQIFSYLNDRELRTVSSVCSIFNKTANEGSLWESLCKRSFKSTAPIMNDSEEVDWKRSARTMALTTHLCDRIVLLYHDYECHLHMEEWAKEEGLTLLANKQKEPKEFAKLKFERCLSALKKTSGYENEARLTHFICTVMLGNTLEAISVDEFELTKSIQKEDILNYFKSNPTKNIVRFLEKEEIHVIARIQDKMANIAFYGITLPDCDHVENKRNYKIISGSTRSRFEKKDLLDSECSSRLPHIATYFRVRALFDDYCNPQEYVPYFEVHTLYQQS